MTQPMKLKYYQQGFPSKPHFPLLHHLTRTVVGVLFTHSPRQRCLSSPALHGALQDGLCNGAVSSDVAKPGGLTSFHCCKRGLFLSSKEVHLLSCIFVCFVPSIRNAEKFPEAFRFKCLYRLSVSAVSSSSRINL